MESNQEDKQPNPIKFQVKYFIILQDKVLLENKKGFKTKNDRIYYFDIHGGWFDEYNNYYDQNGEPSKYK